MAEATRRARPLLGTIVSIECSGLDERHAKAAIDASFREVARIHELMSFHAPESDVSRINREAAQHAIAVDRQTFAVLERACAISKASFGAFDITVAPSLIKSGALPCQHDFPTPDASARWEAIELDHATRQVRFHAPVLIDLGGIAKGYAVDRSLAVLSAQGANRASVNAGGEIGVFGSEAEPVLLRAPFTEAAPVILLANACLASSAASSDTHFAGVSRLPATASLFAGVVAESCMDADALTKVVLALGTACSETIASFNASAYLYDDAWRSIGEFA